MQNITNEKMERIRIYREFCADLDVMASKLAGMGAFVAAAHVQAALDALRQEVIAAEGSN